MNQRDDNQWHRMQAEELLARPCSPDDAARAHLSLGCVHEHAADWEAATASYRKVLACDPQDSTVKYFGNNNLGYSLIQLGRFDEAEDSCLAAIDVDGHRHNAHKNLGLARAGQGRWLDAALSLAEAARLCPEDPRAWLHLQKLLAERPALLDQSVQLRGAFDELMACYESSGSVPRYN